MPQPIPPRRRSQAGLHALAARRRLLPFLEAVEERTLMSGLYTVNSLADTGAGSGSAGDLRYCITQADLAGGATINFSVGGTIQLKSALPDLTRNVTLSGPGATKLTIEGGGASSSFSVLKVDPGVTATIGGLTIAGAN